MTAADILTAIQQACKKAGNKNPTRFQQTAWVLAHGTELYAGSTDLILWEVYQDATTSGKIRTRGDLVIPGLATRARFPDAAHLGLQFRKTFTEDSPPIKRGETPDVEMARTLRARAQLPAEIGEHLRPIGCEQWIYRAHVIQGQTYAQLSPFTNRTYEEAAGLDLEKDDIAELEELCIYAFHTVSQLHRHGVAHGDLHLENLLWNKASEQKALPIDLGSALFKKDLANHEWQVACADDFTEILREAGLLQINCRHRLQGRVFEEAVAQADNLFPPKFAEQLKADPEPPGSRT